MKIVVTSVLVLAGCRQIEDDTRSAPTPSATKPAASSTITVGPKPVDVAAGDLDRDGKLDLVVANNGDKSISVRLRSRDGGWKAPSGDPMLVVGFEPHMIALGDLDRDGNLDLVATEHHAGGVAVWHGDGTGRFAKAVGSPFWAFEVPKPHNHGLAVGDVDGDGDADVVVADQEQHATAVLLSDGRKLARAPGSPFDLGAQTYPPRLGDLDGDGKLDLVAPLVGGAAIAILLGDGAGGFRHAPGSPHKTARDRPYGIALADLDRDGKLDIVAPHDDVDDVTVLLNAGAGRFRDAPGSPVDFGVRIWRPAAADLDGDGKIDIAGAGEGAIIIAHGDGTGRLHRISRHPGTGWAPIAADLDGTGKISIIVPDDTAGTIEIYTP
jgi:hypothetical protein